MLQIILLLKCSEYQTFLLNTNLEAFHRIDACACLCFFYICSFHHETNSLAHSVLDNFGLLIPEDEDEDDTAVPGSGFLGLGCLASCWG